jgi:hypothetical protein
MRDLRHQRRERRVGVDTLASDELSAGKVIAGAARGTVARGVPFGFNTYAIGGHKKLKAEAERKTQTTTMAKQALGHISAGNHGQSQKALSITGFAG